jgi:hypothetical protein
VLRHTGIRIEELTELSHHSLVQYQLPSTGELIPLLQIARPRPTPNGSWSSARARRRPVRHHHPDPRQQRRRPLVVSYDDNEKVWNPPMPLLFQRRLRSEDRPITAQAIRELLNIALDQSGLTDASGQPLRFAPHDFRRLLITDAIMHGMPPHIAQLVPGTATSTPPWDTRPSTPRKSSTGTARSSLAAAPCGPAPNTAPRPTPNGKSSSATSSAASSPSATAAALGTSCIHEHSCIRCPMLCIDPAQRHRLQQIRANLTARIAEAEREGWTGEADGLKVSLAAAEAKIAEAGTIAARRNTAADLGMPAYRDIAGRVTTGPTRP